MNDISVHRLKQKIDNNDNFLLIDVREKGEVDLAKLHSSQHIPMNEIPNSICKLNKNDEFIIMCKTGVRSKIVCDFLIENNFKHVKNLLGGIVAWAKFIDPKLNIK